MCREDGRTGGGRGGSATASHSCCHPCCHPLPPSLTRHLHLIPTSRHTRTPLHTLQTTRRSCVTLGLGVVYKDYSLPVDWATDTDWLDGGGDPAGVCRA